MWRWSILGFFWALWYSQLARAGKAWCFQTIQELGSTVACPGLGSPSGYCVHILTSYQQLVTQVTPSTYTGMLSFQYGIAGPPVTAGDACPVSTGFVVMNIGDYEAMTATADVVAKLVQGHDLLTMAVAIVALLVGFIFGWKVVQRGSSQ